MSGDEKTLNAVEEELERDVDADDQAATRPEAITIPIDGGELEDEPEPASPGNGGNGEAPEFTVHDRRFWATEEGEASEGDEEAEGEPRKPSYVLQLEAEIEARDEQLQDYIKAHKASEKRFTEARQRLERDLHAEVEREKHRLVGRFFEVLDNLDRFTESADKAHDFDALHEGVEIVRRQFLGVLGGMGLERIDPEGEPFDPNVHDAVGVIPVDDPAKNETVIQVLRPGYRVGDRVLRAAMVMVGRKS